MGKRDKSQKELVKKIKSEVSQIEEAFESIEKLISRNERLAEQLLGINVEEGA
ncbi:hypothetical protein BAOM_4612 [Peribacillus asahii]|uniref:Uncharacterized protein n=1 Tax=Peribacillus asahii TaxID=228899 RepID=A0A3Q9RRN0_9BACI|nr:hypothetical protein [Peribacillus asahii]AZV45191.1 hypothetical protein BAOM_4612 [Peribacillus asahii]